MRPGAAVSVAVAAAVALGLAWRAGDSTGSAGVPGVRVVAAPPPPSTTGPTRSAPGRSPSSSTPRARATTGPRSFTGALVGTPFGDVQVRAVLNGGRLIDVVAVHLTDSSGRSVSISDRAAPILRSEALAAGSAKIDTVSGASYTSEGYIQSLQAALDAARAAA
ncbi:MAG: FMN-binding protein [Actinomycetota bacterium]|nr:FMN-binding protein [Actinomycetota bacterium]